MGHAKEPEVQPTFQPESVSLYVRSGSRDAVYSMQLTQSEAGWNVRGQYGRRGSTLSLTEIATNVSYEQAKKLFDKKLKAKLTENPPYRFIDEPKAEPDTLQPKAPASVGLTISTSVSKESLFSCELLLRVEPVNAMPYAKRDRFWFQAKRDDRRLLAVLRNGETFGLNKKGEVVQLDPKLSDGLRRIAKAGNFSSLMFDGEIEATGFWMWDLLDLSGEHVRNLMYSDRLDMLEQIVDSLPADLASLFHVVETAKTTTDKLLLWQRLEAQRAEGFVIKDSTAPYRPGRNGAHLKCKFEKTGSVIVGPKPKSKANDGHRSFAMYCHVAGRPLRFMGTVGCPDKYPLPAEGAIVDVRYLYRHHGIEGKLMQAKYFGIVRDDVRPEECIPEQFRLKQTAEEAAA
jgi:bifunctional non-homologous end joining protein LigD